MFFFFNNKNLFQSNISQVNAECSKHDSWSHLFSLINISFFNIDKDKNDTLSKNGKGEIHDLKAFLKVKNFYLRLEDFLTINFRWKRLHLYHIVTVSPWPFLMGFCMFFFALGLTLMLHRYDLAPIILIWSSLGLFVVAAFWFQDVLEEGVNQGKHTSQVQRSLRLGIILFIVSEVMFFFSFFWAFFHSSLSPTIHIGSLWPPIGIHPIHPFKIPLANTATLLYSGCTITYAHHAIVLIQPLKKELNDWHKENDVLFGLGLTLFSGIWFLMLQYIEYKHAHFDITDSVFGSTFFVMTGFHGFHVFVGFFWLTVCFIRLLNRKSAQSLNTNSWYYLKRKQHIGFEGAIWYWHFVDVVWVGLYFAVYIWGGAYSSHNLTTYAPQPLTPLSNKILTETNIIVAKYSHINLPLDWNPARWIEVIDTFN